MTEFTLKRAGIAADDAAHPSYRIGSIFDLLMVPKDRRKACVSDILRSLEYLETVDALMSALGRECASPEVVTWIDDGVPGLSSMSLPIIPSSDDPDDRELAERVRSLLTEAAP